MRNLFSYVYVSLFILFSVRHIVRSRFNSFPRCHLRPLPYIQYSTHSRPDIFQMELLPYNLEYIYIRTTCRESNIPHEHALAILFFFFLSCIHFCWAPGADIQQRNRILDKKERDCCVGQYRRRTETNQSAGVLYFFIYIYIYI